MTFTSPAVLWALPLGLIPLLLHLLSRRRAQRVDFSDLTLLRQVQAQALPRARLRQWLLAAARCGLIMSLVAAYAGPVLEASGRAPAGAAAQTSEGFDLVVLMDCSYSMGVVDRGRTRWAAARAAAEELLRSLRPYDRVACAAFSDRVEGSGRLDWTAPRSCLELWDRNPPGARGTDFAPALRAAYALLASSRRKRAVLFLSDGAAHGLRGSLPAAEPGVGLYGLTWPPAPFNATIQAAGPARESVPEKPLLRVALWSSGRADSGLDLWRDREHLAANAVALRPKDAITADLPLPSAARGERTAWSGRAQLRPDALPADDAFYYSFEHPRRPRLLILYGNPSFLKPPYAGYFLQQLFAGGTDNSAGAGKRLLTWDADFAQLERFPFEAGASGLRLADYDAAALADFHALPATASAALELFVRRGGSLWLFPGGHADDAPEAWTSLSQWLPVQVGAASEPAATRGLRVERAEPFESWRDFELDQAALTRRWDLTPRSGARVWVRTASGQPLLATGVHGAGRVAAWAAPLDAATGNLPVKPLFAALVSATLSLLHASAGAVASYAVKVGEPIIRVWSPQEAAPARVRVRSPEGRNVELWVRDRRVQYDETAKPGLYTLSEEGGVSRTYAVNLDRGAGESDLASASSAPWRGLSADKLRDEFWLKARGRDARGTALALAAIFALAEMALALPRAFIVLLLLAGLSAPGAAQQGDRFVWTQLQVGPTWDPYPDASAEILQLLGTVTSVLVETQRRVITLQDPALFQSPLVILASREAGPPLGAEELQRLRTYLAGGGMLWIEDTSGLAASSFDRWVRRTLRDLLPESELQPLSAEHVIFKTFFLLRGAAGRVMVRGTLEGVTWGERTAVVYSRDDLLGAWAKDALGRPLLPCLPGGEAQRHNARKLTLNILMYSLTGSYKSDAVHQPYLLQKMRLGVP